MNKHDEDVAIVGMSALFPGAGSLEQYWQNIVDGKCAIEEAPDDWAYPYYDPDSTENGRIYTRKGGFLANYADFDPAEFGIMPNSIEGGDPDGYLVLRLAREALQDAGYLERDFDRSKAGIILGRGNYLNRGQASLMQYGLVLDQTVQLINDIVPDLSDNTLEKIRQSLKKSLPPFKPETVSGLVPNVVTGRVANRLDLMGPNYLVDAACASTLIAIDQGIKELHSGRCDLVLAGGVHAASPPAIGMVFCQIGALSRGDLTPFGATAGGTLLGEGIGIVALKRRADAVQDGDRIYAVIKGVGVSSDGQAKGLLAPRFEGEVLALETGYQNAHVDPKSIGLIEAHGTGIPLGDQTEVKALSRVFGERDGDMPNCAIGSVKSMIGHCLPAAGAAGVIKAALALYHKVLPQTLCDEPNPELKLESSRFYVNNKTRPWVHGNSKAPRRAGVNSFGFGGINAHVVLEESSPLQEQQTKTLQWPTETIAISADSREKLLDEIDHVVGAISQEMPVRLCDLAYTLAKAPAKQERLVVVAKSIDDLKNKLVRTRTALENRERHSMKSRGGVFFKDGSEDQGSTAFIFPGEGAQYTNMLADLCLTFPSVRKWFDRLDQAFVDNNESPPSSILFPAPTAVSDEQRKTAEQKLYSMDFGSEVLSVSNLALAELLESLGVPCDVMLGHSTGEFAALVASGIFHELCAPDSLFKDMRRLHEIHQNMEQSGTIVTGTLLAVGALDHNKIDQTVQDAGDNVYLAMDNCRNQAVIFVPTEKAEPLRLAFKSKGAIVLPLPFDRAYHTPLFDSVAQSVRSFFDTLSVKPATKPLYSCSTAALFPQEGNAIRHTAAMQFATRVRFRETILNMYEEGVRTFIEVGPRDNLTAFVKDILHKQPHTAIASNVQRLAGLQQIQHLLAELYVKGVVKDLQPLFADRSCTTLEDSLVSQPLNKGLKLNINLPVMTMTEPFPLKSPLLRRATSNDAVSHKAVSDKAVSDKEDPKVVKLRRRWSDKIADQERPLKRTKDKPKTASSPEKSQFTTQTQDPNIGMQQPQSIDPRLIALQGHFDLMEQFMQQQARTMQSFIDTSHAFTAGHLSVDRYPLLGSIVFHDAHRLVAQRTYRLDQDLYLHDHTIGVGTPISVLQPDKLALPVVPLTFSVEAIAEAAHCLVGSHASVVGMQNVIGHRWIALEREQPVHLRITAELQDERKDASEASTFIQVKVVELDSAEASDGKLTFEGLVEVAAKYCPPPNRMNFDGPPLIASSTDDENLYRGSMFHGPRLRGVSHIRGISNNRIEADMTTISTRNYFSFTSTPQFQVDPALLDACGQLLGYWSFENVHPAANLFPIQIEQLSFFGPPQKVRTSLIGRASVHANETSALHADIEIADVHEQPLIQIKNWRDRVFPDSTAQHFMDWRLDPPASYFSEPRTVAEANVIARGVTSQRSACLFGAGGVWIKTAAHMILSEEELEQWYLLTGEPNREQWLLGFITAKDAVRQWLLETHGKRLAPIDLKLSASANNGFAVSSRFADQVQFPKLAIKCGNGHATACLPRRTDDWGSEELNQVAAQMMQQQLEMAKTA